MNARASVQPTHLPSRLALRLREALGLRPIDQIGRGTNFAGRPYVSNDGTIIIGEDCCIGSHPIRSHLFTTAGGRVTIGNRVVISYGAAISSSCAIDIGDDSRIGPFCLILDHDYHKVGDRDLPGARAPVQIGRGVMIGARVTILRGASIGDGARAMSGSMISGVIASGAVVGGVPALVAGSEPVRKSVPALVAALVARVFNLASEPEALDGPGQIPAWDGFGAVRLHLALEETFGVTLSDTDVCSAASVSDLAQLIAQARPPRI
jgi:acetyltransferase-like isoleucine patch superfamily enzyme/acyl carrier protein